MMNSELGWILLRYLRHAAEVLLGALLGAWLTGWLAQAWLAPAGLGQAGDAQAAQSAQALLWARGLGGLVGAALGLAVQALRDAFTARRLQSWLHLAKSDEATPDAPRLHGFWADLSYRVTLALREREARARAEGQRLTQFLSAIEASPNGVMLLDPQDHIVWCSQVSAGHFHLDPRRDLGQRITNLVRAPAFVAHLQEIQGRSRSARPARPADSGGPPREPVLISSPRGDRSLAVVAVAFGEEGLALVVSQDVTVQLRTEAMRRDFVANVSHEIRTPLTVVAGFVEALRDLPMGEAERQSVLVHMVQQTQRMQALVDDLLTLALIEGSATPAPDRWLALADLIAPLRLEAELLSAGRHGLRWPAEMPALELAGNETELRSAIGNLLTNAVRYTPEGGQISLAIGPHGDGRLALSVADSGIGIAAEHLPRITERFYRVDGSRSRATGGTGLGLAIVKHVVQRHGGELQISSQPGQGSRFLILLPATRVRHSAQAELGEAV